MAEKKKHFEREFDNIRTSLMREPRGNNGVLAVPVDVTDPRADLGLIFADYRGYVDMCVHGTIGVVTTLVEKKLVSQKKIKRGELVFETPSGLVRTQFSTNGTRKVREVALTNVPSFFLKDEMVRTESFGSVEVSFAFGGNIYGYVDSSSINLAIKPERIKELLKAAKEILSKTKDMNFKLPSPLQSSRVLGISLFQDLKRLKARNVMIAADDLFDRSPCGTGTCGRMAVKFAKGEIALNEKFESRSIIDSVFYGLVIDSNEQPKETRKVIIPQIRGTAYITGSFDAVIDQDDSLKNGFLVA